MKKDIKYNYEQIEEMRSLIDAAYDLVFAYKPEYPAQIVWREKWLENARKFGASLE